MIIIMIQKDYNVKIKTSIWTMNFHELLNHYTFHFDETIDLVMSAKAFLPI